MQKREEEEAKMEDEAYIRACCLTSLAKEGEHGREGGRGGGGGGGNVRAGGSWVLWRRPPLHKMLYN